MNTHHGILARNVIVQKDHTMYAIATNMYVIFFNFFFLKPVSDLKLSGVHYTENWTYQLSILQNFTLYNFPG